MYCNNCNTNNKEIIKEDNKTIYLHCSNCDMSDEEYKQTNEMRVLREFIDEFCPLYDMDSTRDFSYYDLTSIVKEIVEEF